MDTKKHARVTAHGFDFFTAAAALWFWVFYHTHFPKTAAAFFFTLKIKRMDPFLIQTDKATFRIDTDKNECRVSIIDSTDGTRQVFTLTGYECTEAATAFIEASESINSFFRENQ